MSTSSTVEGSTAFLFDTFLDFDAMRQERTFKPGRNKFFVSCLTTLPWVWRSPITGPASVSQRERN